VETDNQREALIALGCDAAQGYLFSRPMPCAALDQYLAGSERQKKGLLF